MSRYDFAAATYGPQIAKALLKDNTAHLAFAQPPEHEQARESFQAADMALAEATKKSGLRRPAEKKENNTRRSGIVHRPDF